MNTKNILLNIIRLSLILVFMTSCTHAPTATPTPTTVTAPPVSIAAPTPTESFIKITSEPTPTSAPITKSREVITPENAGRLTQIDYRGRGVISGIAWSPDGTQISVASSTGTYLVDTTTYGEKRFSDSVSKYVVFSPDGKLLASAEGSAVYLWEITSDKLLLSLSYPDMIYVIAFSPDGKLLVSASQDGTLRLRDVTSGKELSVQPGSGTFVSQVAFSPDGTMVASVAYGNKIVMWEIADGVELRPVSTYEGAGLSFSPSGEMLAISDNGVIKLWSTANNQELISLKEATDQAPMPVFSPDGKILAYAYDKVIKLWDIATQQVIRTLQGHEEEVVQFTFAPDGTRLASASLKTIKIWDVVSGQELRTLTTKIVAEKGFGSQDGYGNFANALAFSPDGEMFVIGGESGPVKLYMLSTGELLGELTPPADRVVRVTFSHDSKLLAVAYDQYVPTEVIGVQIWDVATQSPIAELDDFKDGVFSVDFSPDGTLLATSGGNPWGAPGFVKLWDVATGELILDSGFTNNCTNEGACDPPFFDTTSTITFNPDGSLLAGSNYDGSIHLYDIVKQKEVQVIQGVGAYGAGVAFSPDGKLLAASGSANNDGSPDLKLWNLNSGRLLFNLKGHSQAVSSVAFSPNGQVLASSSVDGSVRLWDVASGICLTVLQAPHVSDIAFSPDGTLLATSGDVLRLWGVPALEGPTLEGTLGYGTANDTAWSPDGKTLAVATSAGIALYDTQNMEYPSSWHSSAVGSINSLSFSPDSQLLAMAGGAGLAVWDVATGEERILEADANGIEVAFSPDGRLLAASSYAGGGEILQIWDVESGKPVIQLKDGIMGSLGVLTFSPDGKYLASASSNRNEDHNDGVLRLWEVSTGKLLLELGDITNRLAGVAFRSNGRTLAFGSGDNSVRLLDIASGELMSKLEGHTAGVVSVTFSPDGQRLASLDISEENQILVWNTATGQLLETLDGCPRTDYANQGNIEFSPDGTRLASACEGAGVMVWEVGTGKAQQLTGYSYGVSDIAFSPDGKLLASGYTLHWDSEQPIDIILWDLQTKAESTRLAGHAGMVNEIAFSPKGDQLASGGLDGIARLWNTTGGVSTIILEGYPMPKDASMQMGGSTLDMLPVSSLAYSPNGSVLAVGGGSFWGGPGWLELYDTVTGKKIASFKPTDCEFPCVAGLEVHDVAFSPDGSLLASVNGDGAIRIWDIANGNQLRTISDTHSLTYLAFSPINNILAAGEFWSAANEGEDMLEEDMRGGVHFWNVDSGERLDLLDSGVESVNSIAFSPDGKLLAVGHAQSITLWDMTTGMQLSQIEGLDYPIFAFSPEETLLAVGDLSGVIQLWRLPDY